jgi:hypothetical protein
MNRQLIGFHLKEALEELQRTIQELEGDPEYEYGDFVVAITHLYHHVNTAWNGREASPEQADRCSEEDFERWRRFPRDSTGLLG